MTSPSMELKMKNHIKSITSLLVVILATYSLITILSDSMFSRDHILLIVLASITLIISIYTFLKMLAGHSSTAIIDENKETDNYLQENNEKLNHILQNAVDGVVTINERGEITFFSRSSEILFGYSESEVIGKNINMLMCDEHKKNHDIYIKFHIETKKTGIINNGPRELKGKRKDGSHVDIEVSVNFLSNTSNEFVGIIRDITERVKAEEMLKGSIKRFTNCIEQFPYSIQIFNSTGVLTNVNGAWKTLWGIDDNVVGSYNIFDDENLKRQGLMKYVEMAFNGTSSMIPVTLFDLINSVGTNRWIQSHIFPVYNSNGDIDEVVLISEDTTDRMRAEDERMKLSRHIRMILESTDQGIFGVNLSGICTFINEPAITLLGYSNSEELLGERILPMIHTSHDSLSSPILKTYTEGESYHSDSEVFSKKDGQVIPIEYSSRPILDDRLTTGAVIVFNDITDRKRSENILKENENKYRQLFGSVSDAIIMFHAESKLIIEVNEAALTLYDYTRESINNITYDSLSNNNLSTERIINTTDYNDSPHLSKEIHKDRNGKEFHVEASFGSFTINKTTIICAAIRNITERIHYEQELKKARDSAINSYKAKSQFLANISHEIRTPMNGILGSLDLLSDTPLNDEQKNNLSTSRECGNNLMAIIDDLLCYTKSESGKLILESIPFDIKKLINSIISQVNTIKNSSIRVDAKISKSMPELLIGDPTRISQIITNFVSNAIKFTQEGIVTISVCCTTTHTGNNHLHIEVADEGIGIPPYLHARIFDTFTQGDASTTRNYGGTGLGLSICKQLISQMNGNIGVISHEGAGSTFWVDICLIKTMDSCAAKSNNKPTTGSIILSGLNILIAEDNLVNQKVATAMLKKLNCTVTIATNGEEAVKESTVKKYDLILMDCQMPKMDGYESTHAIRNNLGPNQNTPIIALTANALHGDDIKCIAAGMNDYMSKPINKDVLTLKINNWVTAINPPKTIKNNGSSNKTNFNLKAEEDEHIK